MFHVPSVSRILLSSVLVSASVAWADSAAGTTPLPDPVVTSPAPELREKNTGVALLWAIGATALPIIASSALLEDGDAHLAVTTAALLVGPSAGQFYAGSHANGFKGMGLRAAAVPVGLLVGAAMASGADEEGFGEIAAFLGGFALGSGITWVVGTGYSLIDAHRAVNRHNARVRVSLVPAIVPVGHAQRRSYAPGMMLTARF